MKTETKSSAHSGAATGLAVTPGLPFRVFEMNDCDWHVARSLEEAKESYLGQVCNDDENVREARELTEAELDKLHYWDSESRDPMDFDHWRCECGAKADGNCRWNGKAYEHHHGYPVGHVVMKNISRRTFREELAKRIAEGLKAPEMFATTEW